MQHAVEVAGCAVAQHAAHPLYKIGASAVSRRHHPPRRARLAAAGEPAAGAAVRELQARRLQRGRSVGVRRHGSGDARRRHGRSVRHSTTYHADRFRGCRQPRSDTRSRKLPPPTAAPH
eukprot:126195-Chlamydomonas_euryale.AAC.7